MAKRKSDCKTGTECRNFVYGLRPPIEGGEAVHGIMRLARRYQNKLVEIEQKRREDSKTILAEFVPGLKEIADELRTINDQIDAAVAAQRQENVRNCERDDEVMQALLKPFKNARDKAYKRYKDVSKEWYARPPDDVLRQVPDLLRLEKRLEGKFTAKRRPVLLRLQAARESWLKTVPTPVPAELLRLYVFIRLEVISFAAKEDALNARRASGLDAGTYTLIDKAMANCRAGRPPKFKRFDGSGRVGIKVRAAWSEMLIGTSLIRIEPAPQLAQRFNKKGLPIPAPEPKRVAQHYQLSLCMCDTEGRPTWVRWPMILDRPDNPVPANAEIRMVTVRCDKITDKPHWEVMFTASAGPGTFARLNQALTGHCAIDIGFRRINGGRQLRIGWLHSKKPGAEVSRELILGQIGDEDQFDPNVLQLYDLVDLKQSQRKTNFNTFRDCLREWIKDHDVPDWLREEYTSMHSWKAIGRMARLVKKWQCERFAGDAEILELAIAWLRNDHHNWQHENNLRDQLAGRREYAYRVFAKKLAAQYRAVGMERVDLRALHDVLASEEERKLDADQRRNARMAGLSVLRRCLREAMAEYIEVPAANTTKTCHACGKIDKKWEHPEELVHTCVHCGASWDRDTNGSIIIYTRAGEIINSRRLLEHGAA